MVPLQLIFLMLIVLVPLNAEIVAPGGAAATGPTSEMVASPFLAPAPPMLTIALIIGTHLALLLFIQQKARSSIRLLHNSAVNSTAVAYQMDRAMSRLRWATVGLAAAQVWGMGWAQVVGEAVGQTQYLKYLPMLLPAIFAAPALLTWMGIWTAQHGVERAIRQRSLPYLLAQGLPNHEMPELGTYVWMQMRHNLYLLVPMALATVVEELAALLDAYWRYSSTVAVPLLIGVLLLLAPWLITRMWDTTPLRGELRARLEKLAAAHRIRFRQIYVWRTSSMVTNAAILGYVPFARYFLMTDALLETLSDRQIEAVFAHEVGHASHKHLWWYAMAICGAFLLAASMGDAAAYYFGATSVLGYVMGPATLSVGLTFGLLGLFLLLGFPFISRRFEHQADWFAARHMGESLAQEPLRKTPGVLFADAPTLLEQITAEQYMRGEVLLEPAIAPAVELVAPAPATVTLQGAEVFNSALETLVDVAHRSRDRASWMHPSINNRLALLRQLAGDERAAAAFRRRMIFTRVFILLVFVAGLAGAVLPEILAWMHSHRG